MLCTTLRQLNHPLRPTCLHDLALRLSSSLDHRGLRMVTLLLGVVLLSLFDLAMTLNQMRSTGMAEGNPLVVLLVQYTQSASIIALFKAITVAVSVSMLYRLRRHAQAEVAAWCAVAVLCALTMQWMRYSDYVERLGPTTMSQMSDLESGWTVLR